MPCRSLLTEQFCSAGIKTKQIRKAKSVLIVVQHTSQIGARQHSPRGICVLELGISEHSLRSRVLHARGPTDRYWKLWFHLSMQRSLPRTTQTYGAKGAIGRELAR
eukprot:scpid56660/ scgid13870/ 